MQQPLFAFAFLFFFPLFSKHTKCILTSPFTKQGRLSLTRKMPCSRADLQSARSMRLLGIKSWPSPCVCWMTIPTACATTRSVSAPAELCSQYWNKHRMANKTPYALVPPAQIRIVLTLKTVHSGWTLSQSVRLQGFTKNLKKIKAVHNKWCMCACNCLQLSIQWQAVWFTTPSTQNPSTASKAIHHTDANAWLSSYPTATDLIRHYSQHTTRCSPSQPHASGV